MPLKRSPSKLDSDQDLMPPPTRSAPHSYAPCGLRWVKLVISDALVGLKAAAAEYWGRGPALAGLILISRAEQSDAC